MSIHEQTNQLPWENYHRRHLWRVLGVVDDKAPGIRSVAVICQRCSQHRSVWVHSRLVVEGSSWGCPRIPVMYRLRRFLQGQPIPTWSVNEPPPWWPA